MIDNATQTSLQLTSQPSNDFSDNSTTTSTKQEISEEQNLSKQRRNVEDENFEGTSEEDILWETAQNNDWYKWATYTAREVGMSNCLMCSKSPLNKVIVVPNPHDYVKCAMFNRHFCHTDDFFRPYCSAECLAFSGNSAFHEQFNRPHWGTWCQYWDVNANIKLEKGKVEIPKWYSIDYSQEYECFNKSTGTHNVGKFKGKCDTVWNLDKTNAYNSKIPVRAPELLALGTRKGEKISPEECKNQTLALPSIDLYEDQTLVVADFFWACGKGRLRASLPLKWKGICARVRLIQEITIAQWEPEQHTKEDQNRSKRAYQPDPNVELDSIGQPRGIPNKYKARDEIKSGFESIFIWITLNKNVEWINYIYYNQQRFINYTDDALSAIGEQLEATSKMTWQNRQALNWLLADKGGVCIMFGDQCCTFIPNNTAPEGKFTEAMNKIKNLRAEVKANAGRDEQVWDWLDLNFGALGAWFAKLGMFLGVAILIGGLLFCCVLPILRSLVVRTTVKQMEVLKCQENGKISLEDSQGIYYQDTNWILQALDKDSSTSIEDETDD